MASAADKKSNYISRVIAATNDLLQDITALEALTLEGQSLGYVQATGGPPGTLADADFVGANGFLTAAVFAQVVATLGQLDAQLHVNNGQILQSLFQLRS